MSTTFDFQDGNGQVPAHRHANPDGSVGGWVAESALVSGNAHVSSNALVSGNAHVSGNAQVTHGQCLSYAWTAFACADGSVRLRYGCESGELSDFESRIEAMCEAHEPQSKEQYVAALRALVAFVRVAVTPVTPVAEGGAS